MEERNYRRTDLVGVITIPENLLNPNPNSNFNFNQLYEFIMKQDFPRTFSFRCKSSNRNVDYLEIPNIEVFEKILPVYRNKFFKIGKEEYVILKDDLEDVMNNKKSILFRETEQLILLAKSCGTMIPLKIDPTLLSLIEIGYEFYFTEQKRESFSNLYNEFNKCIEHSKNNSILLKNNNKKNNIIKHFHQLNEKSKIKQRLKQKIRFLIFAIKCGFTNMKHFKNMSNFIGLFKDSLITTQR
jgi:hypothetical protein